MSTATVIETEKTPAGEAELFNVPPLAELQAESTTETIDETIPLASPGASTDGPNQSGDDDHLTAAREIFLAAAVRRAELEKQLKSAKKAEKKSLDEYRLLASGKQLNLPLAESKPPDLQKSFIAEGDGRPGLQPGEIALVGAYHEEDAAPAAASRADDWRSVSLCELNLKPSLVEKLAEADVLTIGQLEDLRAGAGLKSIKGIGQAKADAIEEAVIDWLTKNRDSRVMAEARAAAAGQSGSDLPTSEGQESSEGLPAAAVAEQTSPLSTSMPVGISRFDPDAERAAGIEDRVIQLLAAQRAADERNEGEECLEPELDDERWWNGGVEAYDRGVPVRDCPIDPPGPEQDDWLRGWLTANLAEETQV